MRHHRSRALAGLVVALMLGGCRSIPPAPLRPEQSAAALSARSLDGPGLRDFVESHLDPPPEHWPPPRWNLALLTLAAVYYQPRLDVARARWRGADAGVTSAGARPNPSLSVAPTFTTNPEKGLSPWLALVHLDWRIETAGKRGDRIRRAQALSAAERYALSSEVWGVRGDLRSALLDLAAARARAAALQGEVEAEGRLVALLEDRVRAGAASRSDLAPPQLALIQATADRTDAQRLQRDALARLAEAVGVPTHALEGVEIDFSLETEGGDLLTLAEDEAKRAALYGRADVLAALAHYAASEEALRLELARQYPDLNLGAGYEYDQGQNKWSIGFSVDLPLLDRNQGPIAEAEAAREQEAARFVALQAAVLARVERAVANRQGALDQVSQLEALTAESRAQLERARAGLALGAYDRTAVLQAQTALARERVAVVDARVNLQRALGDLEGAVQGPLLDSEAVERSERVLPGREPS